MNSDSDGSALSGLCFCITHIIEGFTESPNGTLK